MSDILRYPFKTDIQLWNLGDIHRGDHACNRELYLKAIDTIRRDRFSFWVSTGDILNVALKDSKSSVYTSWALEKEYEAVVKELAPISGKCLGIVTSNHHRRFERAVGMSLDKMLAHDMAVPFLGQIGLLNVICGKASYYIALHHGTGMGKRRGSKTNNTEDLAVLVPGADIYMEGHTHAPDFFIDEMNYIDRKRGLFRSAPAYFCVTGHFLDYGRSYAPGMKLRPMPQGAAVLELREAGAGNVGNKKVRFDLFN